jgi:hypothetical protein
MNPKHNTHQDLYPRPLDPDHNPKPKPFTIIHKTMNLDPKPYTNT